MTIIFVISLPYPQPHLEEKREVSLDLPKRILAKKNIKSQNMPFERPILGKPKHFFEMYPISLLFFAFPAGSVPLLWDLQPNFPHDV